MALTGLQIFKYLPGGKKESNANCKKCGFPTCMAYAMKLAKKEASIDACEFISDELRDLLIESTQVAQIEVKFGTQNNKKAIGGETVMFRHDKTFVNPLKIAIKLSSNDPEFDNKLEDINNYAIERIAQEFRIDAINLVDAKDGSFSHKAKLINDINIALILETESSENLISALEITRNSCPIVKFNGNTADIIDIIKQFNVPIIVSAPNLDSLAEESQVLIDAGIENLILNIDQPNINSKQISNLIYIRRAAIEKKFKPFGFPIISYLNISDNPYDDAVGASFALCKYSNMIVFDSLNKALITSLSVLSQNIFTDPQKPLQVEPKLYEVAEPDENSVVFVTTNFALTYFAVVNELEGANIPSYLVITPSDGMSVLTAWSASKFTGEIIAKAVKSSGLDQKINHRNLIIPGAVSSLVEEIKDELPDWNIIVGTNEAIDIPDFINAL